MARNWILSLTIFVCIATVSLFALRFRSITDLHAWANGVDFAAVFLQVKTDAETGNDFVIVRCRNLSFRKMDIHNILLPCGCLRCVDHLPLQLSAGEERLLSFELSGSLPSTSKIEFICFPNVRTNVCLVPPINVNGGEYLVSP